VDERQVRTTADNGLTTLSASFATDVSDANAKITDGRIAQVTADSALAGVTTTIAADLSNAEADYNAKIVDEKQVRVGDGSSMASTLTALAASVVTADSAALADITDERQVRVTEDSATASTSTALSAALVTDRAAALAGITTANIVRTTEDSALAGVSTTLSAGLKTAEADYNAKVVEEKQARVEDGSAMAGTLTELSAKVSTDAADASAKITDERVVRVLEDSAAAATSTALAASFASGLAMTNAEITSERLVRTTADEALAASQERLKASMDFDSGLDWQFEGGVSGWTAINGTLTYVDGKVTLSSVSQDVQFFSSTLSLTGADYPVVRMRIKRVSGADWQGTLYYATGVRGYTESFRKTIADATVTGEWRILEWDMTALTQGGADWLDSTITNLRFDLAAATGVFDIDWIAVGRAGLAGTSQILEEKQARVTEDSALAGVSTTLSAGLKTAEADYNAKVVEEKQARVEDGSAMAGTLTELSASVITADSVATAGIVAERIIRVTEDSAAAATATALSAEVNEAKAAITTEALVRVSERDAFAGQLNTLEVGIKTKGGSTALNNDPGFANPAAWESTYFESGEYFPLFVTIGDGVAGTTAIRQTPRGGFCHIETVERIAVNPTRTYRLSVYVRNLYAGDTIVYVSATGYTSGNVAITLVGGDGIWTSTTWTQAVYEFGAGTGYPIPPAVLTISLGVMLGYYMDMGDQHELQDIRLTDITDELLIKADATAKVTEEKQVRVTEDSATASSLTGLSAAFTTADATTNSRVTTEQQARATEDSAMAASTTALSARLVTAESVSTAGINTVQLTQVTADSALATAGTELSAALVTEKAASLSRIIDEQTTRVTEDSATASSLTGLSAALTTAGVTNAAAVTTLQQAVVTADSAMASSVTQLSSAVGENKAALEITSQSVDGIRNINMIKSDINGVVTGYGLVSELVDGGEVTSQFVTNVDQFAVTVPVTNVVFRSSKNSYVTGEIVKVPDVTKRLLTCVKAGTRADLTPAVTDDTPLGTKLTDGTVVWQVSSIAPFVVQTIPSTIDGVSIPAGIYMDAAYIREATITGAQIGEEAVDSTHIANLSVDKLTAGTITADDIYLGNTNFTLSAANRRMTISDGTRTRFEASPTGIGIYDANGNAILTSGSGVRTPNGNLVRGLATWTRYGTAWLYEGEFAANDRRSLIIPTLQTLSVDSPQMSLHPGTYTVSFEAFNNVGAPNTSRTLQVDLFPDTLPQATFQITPARTKYTAVFTSNHSDMSDCRMRFFTEVAEAGQLEIYNVKLEVGSVATPWVPHVLDTVGVLNPITSANASTYIASAAIGFAQIKDDIQSTDYVPGSTGWKIAKGGTAEFNTGTFRGTLSAALPPFSSVVGS
jgi:hypothetical protein